MSTEQNFEQMSDLELQQRVRLIVSTSRNETEVRSRVKQELGYRDQIMLAVIITGNAAAIVATFFSKGGNVLHT